SRRRDRGRRHVPDDDVSEHRCGKRRDDRRIHRRVEQDPRPRSTAASRRRRDVHHPRPRAHLRRSRRPRVSRHDRHRPRSHPRRHQEGHDARSDQGRAPDARLRCTVRRGVRSWFDGELRRVGVSRPEREEIVMKKLFVASTVSIALAAVVSGQQRGAGGGRGNQPPLSGQQAAPVDLTGYWVSVVTEDWRWRMATPPKGDYQSLPLNQAARKAADAWDPAKDEAAGLQCKPYGAGNIYRQPGRLHITWEDENTLK